MKYRRTKIKDEGNSSKQKYHWLDNHLDDKMGVLSCPSIVILSCRMMKVVQNISVTKYTICFLIVPIGILDILENHTVTSQVDVLLL